MAAEPTYAELVQRIEALERELNGCRCDPAGAPVRRDPWTRMAAEQVRPVDEQQFREIVDTMGGAIWLFDWKRRRVVYVNAAYEAIWGRSAAALYDRYAEWAESLHPDDLAFAKESFVRIAETGKSEKRDYRIVRPDGSVRWISDRGYAIRDRQGRVVRLAGIAEDITDRKQAEETLRKQNQYLTALHETAVGLISRHEINDLLQNIIERAARLAETDHGYIYLYDDDTDTMALRYGIGEYKKFIAYHIRTGKGLTGRVWQSGQTITIDDYQSWPERIPDDYFSDLRSVISIPLKSGDQVIGVIGLGRFGAVKAFHETEIAVLKRLADLAAIAYSNARLTAELQLELGERKRAEKRLRRYEKIVATSKDLMALIDGNAVFLAVSDSYLKAHGRTREEIIGSSMQALIGHARFEKDIKPRFDRCLAGEEVTFRLRFDFAGIGSRFMEASYAPYKDDKGDIIGVVVVSRDITETKTLEEQLLQSQKMEAIGTLAGGIAHDFNNLLMGIQGRTSVMLADIDADHPHFENLKGIEGHIRSASNLTRQLLGFARGGKYEVQPLDLGAVIREKNRLFGRMQKGIAIQEKLQRDLWPVEADRSQIEQVLLNIYINAWQAMPGSGTLCVQTANVHLDSDVVAAHKLSAGRYVKISVTDTGVGMDAATCRRIFEPFFTTKEMGRGTGLGLASAYGIVKNHGGFITVDSVEGKGTTVDIYLPATDKRVAADVGTTEPLLRGAGTVLLVDDEKMIVAVGAQMLRRLGYEVLTAGGGREALQICKRHHARISLVILDFIMPDLGGGETCALLKAAHPAVKVLLSSGYSLDGKAGDIVKYGGDGFIQKPFDLNTLSQKINAVLSR
ncbi:MAG: PAS domain S-box protein [Deltaproteobacteria bacterium]|nr:PAS domain S-box protein [Deltaproteobacteria bacterium]